MDLLCVQTPEYYAENEIRVKEVLYLRRKKLITVEINLSTESFLVSLSERPQAQHKRRCNANVENGATSLREMTFS